MADQLTIVNSVLERLREDTVTTVSENDYSKLIAKFVNDAKADMEDVNWEWSVYTTEIDTTILADGTRSYDLTGTNDRSHLIRQKEDRLPMAFDITTNEKGQLYDIPYKELLECRATETGVDVAIPRTFSITTDADGRGYTLTLLWGADNARSWRTYWYVPQADLSTSSGDDDMTEILLPRRPIENRAYYYALEDRGEATGPSLQLKWEMSQQMIGAALELDMQVMKKSDENDFRNEENL